MCTQIHLVLPHGADAAAVAAMTERCKVGRGLAAERGSTMRSLAASGAVEPAERLYVVVPWKQCHCDWSPADFAGLVGEALRSGATLSIGVVASEGLGSYPLERAHVDPAAFSAGECDDQDVVYVVEPDRTPRPVARRHGSRRRRRAAGA